ncbi:hypothetical protein GCM10010220_09940 [Streptomyces parvulus]|nr:hypothetical protein GCM10010220_09940 [Streptomyces parvulus]
MTGPGDTKGRGPRGAPKGEVPGGTSKGRVRRTPLCGDPARAGCPPGSGTSSYGSGRDPIAAGFRDDITGQG